MNPWRDPSSSDVVPFFAMSLRIWTSLMLLWYSQGHKSQLRPGALDPPAQCLGCDSNAMLQTERWRREGSDRGGGNDEARCLISAASRHMILPSCTGDNITNFQSSDGSDLRHYAYPAQLRLSDVLWVHLPGSMDASLDSSELMGSRPKIHRIVLSYDNVVAVESEYCLKPEVASLVEYIESDVNETQNECWWAVRYQIVTGRVWKSSNSNATIRDAIDTIRIGDGFHLGTDGIENRLLRLLRYLHFWKPREFWGRFLKHGAVDWSRIILSGHSQGGGHAAMLSFLHPLRRVFFLSSPCDVSSWTTGKYCDGAQTATPCAAAAKPIEGYYGMVQAHEIDICNITVPEYHWRNLMNTTSLGDVKTMIHDRLRAAASSYPPNKVHCDAFVDSVNCTNSSSILCEPDIKYHLSTATNVCAPANNCYQLGPWPYLAGRPRISWIARWALASSLGRCRLQRP
ncbi:unnamed protein product [Effrenium voratum]|nr:unnamed protein product [Effrenium voratum]